MENIIFIVGIFIVVYCGYNVIKNWKEMDCSKQYNDYYDYKINKYHK